MKSLERTCAPVTALVPIKARNRCKTRLATHLLPEQRVALVRSMLQHVVDCLEQTPSIERLVVLSPERDQLPAHIDVRADEGWDLNSSLQRAIRHLWQQPCTTGPHAKSVGRRILILPADLACLQVSDVQALIEASTRAQLVIAPSSDQSGTNALVLPSTTEFPLWFGVNSFYNHVQQAKRLALSHAVVQTGGLGFDVDTRTELDWYRSSAIPAQLDREKECV